MTKKIATLQPRVEVAGIRFPQLYRVQGYSWAGEKDDAGNMVNLGKPDENFPMTLYVLEPAGDTGLAEVTRVPIVRPDAVLEAGKWVIVRHHKNEAQADGYVHALLDCVRDTDDVADRCLFRTPEGLFTVMVRDPLDGRPTALIGYRTATDGVVYDVSGGTFDEDVLLPLDEEDKAA
jgi:hypothetical protein